MALFLSICSSTKDEGGADEYDNRQTLVSALPQSLGEALLDRRRRVLQLVKNNGDFESHGFRVAEHEHNRTLQKGRDFGGQRKARYMPAIQRYRGRFFQTLDALGARKLGASSHHTLFLSGLYGLLRPLEPIQLYSCPLEPEVAEIWREDDLLTRIVREYVARAGIARIVDLTAVDAYRNLIDWPRIEQRGAEVLHAFHPAYKGDAQLIPFAAALGGRLLDMSEDELIALDSDTHLGDITLRRTGAALPGAQPEWRKKMEAAQREKDLVQPHPARMLDYVARGGNPERQGAGRNDAWLFAMTPQFVSDLAKHADLRKRVLAAIVDLLKDPKTPHGNSIKPLTGRLAGLWRYRIGDYRLVYEPDATSRIVYLLRTGPRGSIYE